MDHACGVLRSTTPSSGSLSIAVKILKCDILFRKVNQIMMAACCAPCVETCGDQFLYNTGLDLVLMALEHGYCGCSGGKIETLSTTIISTLPIRPGLVKDPGAPT